MTVQLSMVGIAVADMAASLAFYRQLGLVIPHDRDTHDHVELKLDSGISLFWNTFAFDPGRGRPTGYGVVLEFFLPARAAVDATYADLTQRGYQGYRAPFDTPFGSRFAMVHDPDGNTVLLSAERDAAPAALEHDRAGLGA